MILIPFIMGLQNLTFGQMQTLQLDPLYMHFDNGRELPAEESFIVHAPVKQNTAMVKMQISNREFDRNILYENIWIRKDDETMQNAILPNYLVLRSGSNYNIRFLYYNKIQEAERRQIREMLETTAQTFLQTNIQRRGNRYNFQNSPARIYSSLNTILSEGMQNYEIRPGTSEPRFSGIVENMLRTLARYRITDDEGYTSPFDALLRQVSNEINMFSNSYEFVIEDVVTIMNYPTERKTSALAINVGYGGIYDSGNFSDLSYFSAPYVGIDLPLGNQVFAGNFWGNTSIAAGVYLSKFENTGSRVVSGPIIDLPIFASLNYRTFRFLKLQAGATLLEEQDLINDNKSLFVRPFIGLSIEFNIWLGRNR
ncbi:MAG: hypothetical protein EA393_00975 [Bacteroidetes bacterium]|nr:MAG: hypothetical protein EA393_00975 [Bacteroidota bacterium]